MAKPIPAREPQSNERQNKFLDLVVTVGLGTVKRGFDPNPQVDSPKEAVKKLKTRETGEFLICELDLKISVDSIVDFAIF